MNQEIYLGGRRIAADAPVFIVAEMSANHLQDYDRAIEIIHAAKEAGADAIKLQTYTADTMTVDSDADCFINKGGLWDGIKEYDLYKQAYTPWEWHAGLMEEAKKCGLLCFSSPFDATAVDFIEELDAPAYKIASYEINDIPLIRRVAKLHKPVLFATGIAHLDGGPDGAFSMEPQEFKEMVSQIRILEKALGSSEYRLTPTQEKERAGSRSIFVAQDMAEGEVFTEQNIRCIRPGIGLHTMYYEEILGRKASCPIRKGTPLSWNLIR